MTPPWISGPVVDSVASHSRARRRGDAYALPWRPASRRSPTRASSIARRGGHMTDSTISIVAIGGSTRPDSSSERAVRLAARGARDAGAHVTTITGRELMLPIYDTETSDRTQQALALVEAIRRAHGLLVASPSYHGGVRGMIKNALDYIEDLASHDPRTFTVAPSAVLRSPTGGRRLSRRCSSCDRSPTLCVAGQHRSVPPSRPPIPDSPKMARPRMPPPTSCARSVNRWSNSRLCAQH